MRKKVMLTAALLALVLSLVFVFAACDGNVASFTLILDNGDETTTSISDQTVVATAPEAPERSGYRFEGWYVDPAYTTEAVFPMTMTSDVTLYAKWTRLYTVSFVVNGGSNIEDMVTDVIESSPRTYRDGFVFAGWYTSPRLTGAQVTFPYTPTKDSTLYAKWTEDTGTAEYEQTTGYDITAKSALKKLKGYFNSMSGTAIDYDSLLTTTNGTARIQLQINLAEGESTQMMFRISMQDDESVSFAIYALNGEVYLDFGDGQAYVHLSDFKAEYLVAILQQVGAEIDVEELLNGIAGNIDIYGMLVNLIFNTPQYTKTVRVATGELVGESLLFEVKVNSLISGLKSILDMFNVGDLIGIDLDLSSLFNWLNAAVPQVKMYLQVDCENGMITGISTSVSDNATGSAGDELLSWKSTKIGYYDYAIYIDMPTDIEGNSREFSFTNLAFDVDLALDAPESGLDVAKLIGLFTDNVPLPENTLIIEGKFGFRLSARVDIDLNYAGSSADNNLIALDLYVLGADGQPTGDTPALGIYYRDGAFYVSLSDLIPDYWKAKNIKIEANLDALIGDFVDLITKAIDGALGTDFDEAKSLPLSSDNMIEATLSEDGGEVKAIISPTISGLISAVVGVIGLQENVYVDAEGDSLVVEVNRKFFDVINGFLGEENKITLPAGLSNMSLSVNFADYGVKDVVATIDLGDESDPLGATLTAHNFKIGFLEGSMQDLGEYIAERTDGDNYTSNLGDMIYSVLAGVEVNAGGKLSVEAAEYALGKLLANFGLDTGSDNPVLGLSANNDGGDRYEVGIDLLAAFSIDKQKPENSKLAIELAKADGNILLGVYGYYENGVSTVLLDLSGIKTQFVTLPVYKFEFDFANIVIDLIENININGKSLTDFDLAFDLSGLIGGSAQAESLIMTESDGTAGGTELTEAGAILVGLSADKITASVAFAAIIRLLEALGVDTGISPDVLDLSADVSLSTQGVTLDLSGTLPKVTTYDGATALPTEYGDYTLSLETGTESYPISIGSVISLDAAIARGKEKAAAASDSLYDVVFDLANSMQASMTIQIANEKDTIDIASMINNILAKEGSYIGFPINLQLDKNDANLYLDLKWDIHMDSPFDTKIYLELRYGQKKIASLGIQEGDLFVDLEGLGLFEFKVVNSELATSLFTMLDEKVGVLRDTDIGALLTELITGAGTVAETGDGSTGTGDQTTQEGTDTKAILAAILGDISIYDGVIKANIAASTFDTIFTALLGTTLGVKIEVNEGEIDLDGGIVRLPVSVNDTFNLTAELALKPAESFTVTSDSGKVLDATDGEAMARSLLKCLNMDFNLDILTNNIDSPDNRYLRVRIKNYIEGSAGETLANTSKTVGDQTLVISIYTVESEDMFNNTTAGYGDAIIHVVLDYAEDAPENNMTIVLAENKFEVLGIDLATMSLLTDNLQFNMDIVGMLSGAMQSLIDALVFTDDGVEVDLDTSSTDTSDTGEEESAGIFDDLDINELLSGGITISLRSTGTLNIDAELDPYIFNKLIDDIMGGMVFGENSTLDVASIFGDNYFKYVIWDRLNTQDRTSRFWQTLREQLFEMIKGIMGDFGFAANMLQSSIYSLIDDVVYEIVAAILPFPIYNEVHAGVNLVDGTLSNIYINGYDHNEDVVNDDGEVLTYSCGSTYIEYKSNSARNKNYKTEINLYDCFDSVGDPDNTVDGSGNAGIVNWGNMEFDMAFDPLAYSFDAGTADAGFIKNYFVDKIAVYQQGTTVMKTYVEFYLYDEETQSYGEKITTTSDIGLLDYANNDNMEETVLKGKAVASFPNGVTREREFTITVYPNLEPALIDTVTLHAYDDAPSSITVYFKNMSSRRVEISAIKSLTMPSPTIEGGTYQASVTFVNDMTATLNIEYLDSTITTLGSDGESGVYELDLYAFDGTLDIMSQLPSQLFFSYPDGKYGAIDVESWSVDAEVLQTFAQRQPSDLGDYQFTAIATVGKGVLEQTLELTVRIKGKEVTSLTIDGNENTVVVNPYDYYLHAMTAAAGATFSPWPTSVDANYVYNGVAWSESVNVEFSTGFDFSTMTYNTPGTYEATATLAGSEYFTWSKTVSIDVQSNVIAGVYFDRALRRDTISIDAVSFNAMTADEKMALFPTTAWVKFTNGYVLALPIRWTDRNGYELNFETLTFDASDYDVTVYAEIGFGGEVATTAADGTALSAEEIAANQAAMDALEAAFYQRQAMTVKVSGSLEYVGSGVTVDPFEEGGAAQFPTEITVGSGQTSFNVAVTDWNVSGVDFSAIGGEYLAAASYEYNNKTYSVIVPVTVTAKKLTGFSEITGAYYATYDETANTVTVEINGNSYVVSETQPTAALTAEFEGGATASLNATLDLSALVPTDETVYYDGALGTTAEEQGATAFTVKISVTDAAGNVCSVDATVYMSIVNEVQPEQPEPEPEVPSGGETPVEGE